MKRKISLWLCKDCNEYFIGELVRHVMYYCPHCKKNAVDIEETYTRMIGNVQFVKNIRLK
jgi:Zn finger protein HypA/HybF involved in hydrogenase expression